MLKKCVHMVFILYVVHVNKSAIIIIAWWGIVIEPNARSLLGSATKHIFLSKIMLLLMPQKPTYCDDWWALPTKHVNFTGNGQCSLFHKYFKIRNKNVFLTGVLSIKICALVVICKLFVASQLSSKVWTLQLCKLID